MRAADIIMIIWFIIVILLDKLVKSNYNIILLTISLIFVIVIHLLIKRDRARRAAVVDRSKNR